MTSNPLSTTNESTTKNKEHRYHHYRASATLSLRHFLLSRGYSDERIEFMLYFGAIYIGSGRTRSDVVLNEGDVVRVHPMPKRFPKAIRDWRSRIVATSKDFIVVNKPGGVPCHPTLDNYHENAIVQVQEELGYPLYTTHRIDQDTMGLLVLARNKAFQRSFNDAIAKGHVNKFYFGLSHCPLKPGDYLDYMKKSPRAPKKMIKGEEAIKKTPLLDRANWKRCLLRVRSCEPVRDLNALGGSNYPSVYRIDFEPLTGRPHQIRAQSALHGSPLLGDRLYNPNNLNNLKNLKDPNNLNSKEFAFENLGLVASGIRFTDTMGQTNEYHLEDSATLSEIFSKVNLSE